MDPIHADELTLLRTLARSFPTIDTVAAEIAHLTAVLSLPKGTVYVVSDIHGDHQKFQHVVNNASGALRPLYLWTGPRSPLFGKDRMTTFERYFVADGATHRERKGPYFKPRRVADTEVGADIRAEVAALERLIAAYRDNAIPEESW